MITNIYRLRVWLVWKSGLPFSPPTKTTERTVKFRVPQFRTCSRILVFFCPNDTWHVVNIIMVIKLNKMDVF